MLLRKDRKVCVMGGKSMYYSQVLFETYFFLGVTDVLKNQDEKM